MSDAAIPALALTIKTGEAVAARRFITIAGSYPANDGDNAVGVTRAPAASGEYTAVDVLGLVAVEASGAIAVGDAVMAEDDGRAKKLAGNEVAVARAFEAATAAGDIILVMMIPN
ncbi:MAG: DUF2190 family protein [Gammaproteobacteria bacterium]|nr:DUF2190 family protein [Gammaproteobacteria bacterium]